MALTVEAYSGTETVGTTEHSLTTDSAGPDTDTTAGAYQCWLDVSAIAAGSVFEWRLYEKVKAGEAQKLADVATFTGGSNRTAVWRSPTDLLGVGWDMTLVKITGADCAIPWRISKAT